MCRFSILILSIILFIGLLAIGKIYFHKNEYASNSYLNDLKISSDLKLSSIEKIYGSPKSIQDYGEDFYTIDYGVFDVLVLKDVYNTHNGSEGDTRLYALIFTNPEYKFSNNKPGIGSTKEYAMNYYKDELSIKDISSEENMFGYVIGSYYIYFICDDKNIITKIHISSGL